MVERLHKVKPGDLTENSVLMGWLAADDDTLKKVEAAGFNEVILYFNVGLKPHRQVKDEMARFAEQVKPAFPRRPISRPRFAETGPAPSQQRFLGQHLVAHLCGGNLASCPAA